MKLFATLMTLALLALGTSANAALVEDFDGGGNTAFNFTNSSGGAPAVLGGGPTGNFARLANLNGSNNNSIAFDVNPTATGSAVGFIRMQYDFRMTDDAANAQAGGCCGSAADGLGIGLFQTSTYGNAGAVNPTTLGQGSNIWERPAFNDAFTVGMDIFQNIDVITLNFNGAEVAAADVQAFLDLNSNVYHRATVDIIDDGAGNALVDMTVIADVNGAAVSHDIFTGQLVAGLDLTTLGDYRLIAGGRTGGAFVAGDFDNILVEEGVVPEPATAALGLMGLAGLVLRRRREA